MPAIAHSVFLDATYLIALATPRDQYHPAARELLELVVTRRARMVTTRAVLLEVGNSLADSNVRPAVVAALESCERDPLIEIVPLSEGLFAQAFSLFRQRPDKSWGLTDCVSFVVMRAQGIAQALTADEHFEQAGFVALLKM